MANKKLLLVTFCVVALIQLYVPAKMIFDSEDILTTGKEFKFKTEPIDPNDPF
ncbi:MAG: GDYXXLXY protein, partial [Sphingobacteriaceae bacterium]|nr:GDYXXLXY protein [Sphingobacteriaceae bacterium]